MRFGRLDIAGAAAALLLGLGAGCSDSRTPRTPLIMEPVDIVVPVPPSPNSPANLLRGLEWSYNHRSLGAYGELFTDDFLWNCSPTDSAGSRSRGTPWTRSDELGFARNLFLGGGPDQPAAASIALKLDPDFFVYPDPNSTAWDPLGRWHRSVRTTVNLRVALADGASIEILGHATFSVVRGDSAMIPEELRLRGARPDSTRWYVRRWDDETATPAAASRAPLRAQPSSAHTWCALKERYH